MSAIVRLSDHAFVVWWKDLFQRDPIPVAAKVHQHLWLADYDQRDKTYITRYRQAIRINAKYKNASLLATDRFPCRRNRRYCFNQLSVRSITQCPAANPTSPRRAIRGSIGNYRKTARTAPLSYPLSAVAHRNRSAQTMPVRSTKRIAAQMTRLSMGGRPPRGKRAHWGKKSLTAFPKSSIRSGWAMRAPSRTGRSSKGRSLQERRLPGSNTFVP